MLAVEILANPIVPDIHLNGTSAVSLIEDLSNAYDSLNQSYDAIKKSAPNGRDYYLTPGKMTQAEAQHRGRLELVQFVMTNIEKVTQEISDHS